MCEKREERTWTVTVPGRDADGRPVRKGREVAGSKDDAMRVLAECEAKTEAWDPSK